MSKLKKCPFCGGSPTWCGDDIEDPHTCHQISCVCGMQFDSNTKEANAAETMEECRAEIARLWNTREEQ